MHRIDIPECFIILQPDRKMRNSVPCLQGHRGKIASFMLVIATKCIVKDFAPTINHRLNESVGIKWRVRCPTGSAARVIEPIGAMSRLHAPLNEWSRTSLE